MLYTLEGTIPLDQLVNQEKQDTKDNEEKKVLLQVESNFANFMNFGNMRSQERDSDEDKIPLKIQSVDTRCKYQAPTIAAGQNNPGLNVNASQVTFKLSNPPFLICDGSVGGTYSINFAFSKSDGKKFIDQDFSGHQKVKIQIVESIGGNNLVKNFDPKYSGTLVTDEGTNSEKSYDLVIERGTNIFTECVTGAVQ